MKTKLSIKNIKDGNTFDLEPYVTKADMKKLKALEKKYPDNQDNERIWISRLTKDELIMLDDVQNRATEKAGVQIDGKTGRILQRIGNE